MATKSLAERDKRMNLIDNLVIYGVMVVFSLAMIVLGLIDYTQNGGC